MIIRSISNPIIIPHYSFYFLVLKLNQTPSNTVIRSCCFSATSRPNKHTYPCLLKALSKSKNKNPHHIHAQIIKFGFHLDTFVLNSLVTAYANGGYLNSSIEVFDEMPQRDVVSWTAAINGFVNNGQPKLGLDCFIRMRSLGVRIDEVTVVSLLRAVGMLGDIGFGRWIHGFYVELGRVHCDVYVGSALIDMYAKCGVCDDARKVFNGMCERNIVSWSALIAGYVHCSRFKEALVLFQDMLVEEVEPNEVTLSSVLTACAYSGALDQGRWVHGYIEKNDLHLSTILGTTLMDMYAKCGCVRDALLVFQKLRNKNVYSWTTMINGLAIHGHALSALNVFSRMLMDGVKPNGVTFIAILRACCHGGLVDKGLMFFGSMSRIYGIEPNMDHYGCLVDLLGRAGHLNEALNVITSMPMEPSPGVWGALLNACIIHKNYKLGARLGEYLIELEPDHSGRYMLLAKLYSMWQKWEEVATIRRLMKGKGVDKTPGCSSIEVNGDVHEFVASEKLHSPSKDVYLMLDSINSELVGFEPDDI